MLFRSGLFTLMGVTHHETRMEPVVAGASPGDNVAAYLHETPVTAVRELVIHHLRVRLSARCPDSDVPGMLLALQRVRVPRFTQTVVERHSEKRVRREEVRGVAPELRLHNVSGRIGGIRGQQDIRLLWRIRVIRRVRSIRNDRKRRVRVTLTREVPVFPDFLQVIDISTCGEIGRASCRERV